ncbi:protein RETICULATA-RELATED 1, chloroplastic [Cinnamomum micranthum f. kanehirae]|uniref:Protein RETICULATA-RELATED 1, chloroplastic n=1 Tax=Cinnamomum micranthum f. kanehirae TaxID=337451 RepID=A0A3S3QQR4_9MAGN|nr:protein RETICULATA-RELATED 1, chloroplastic [Cinnamomum micranthum f. kanehirae]
MDFWEEFELYVADLLVGVVVDIALVGLLAPYVRIGKPSVSKGFFGRVQQTCGALPSRDVKFTSYFWKTLWAMMGGLNFTFLLEVRARGWRLMAGDDDGAAKGIRLVQGVSEVGFRVRVGFLFWMVDGALTVWDGGPSSNGKVWVMLSWGSAGVLGFGLGSGWEVFGRMGDCGLLVDGWMDLGTGVWMQGDGVKGLDEGIRVSGNRLAEVVRDYEHG